MIKEGQAESLLVFTDKDPVAGEVTLKLDPGKRLEHLGVKIEFIGMIEMFYGNYHEFSNLVRDLDAPGELTATKTYPFDFSTVDKQVCFVLFFPPVCSLVIIAAPSLSA